MWMFYSWLADKQEQNDMFYDYGTFVGSFSNPEMAKQIWDSKNPKYSSTDEEFEQSSKNMLEAGRKLSQVKHRRHRRRKVINK